MLSEPSRTSVLEQADARQFALVAAHDSKLGIGKNGAIPWQIASDLESFRNLTTAVKQPPLSNLVLMGRKTWESIPPHNRPLSGRINLILTNNQSFAGPPQIVICHSMDEVQKSLNSIRFETCFVIGGASLYRYALADRRFNTIHLTEIVGDFECDVFFPEYRQSFALDHQSARQHDNGYTYRFSLYKRK